MNFLKTLRATLYSPSFYQSIRTQGLQPVIKLTAILAAIGMAIFAIQMVVQVVPLAKVDAPGKLQAAYPEGLEVTLASGEVTINQPEPYFIPNTLLGTSSPKYLVIFDGNDTLSADPTENSTLVIVKRKYFIGGGVRCNSVNGVQSCQSDSRLVSFSAQQPTTTVTHANFVGGIEKFKPFYRPLIFFGTPLLGLLMIIVGTFFWTLGHMVYALIPAALVFIFAFLTGKRMLYKQCYVVTLYATLPIMAITFILSTFGFHLPPYAYTLVVLLVIIANRVVTYEASTA